MEKENLELKMVNNELTNERRKSNLMLLLWEWGIQDWVKMVSPLEETMRR